MNSKTVGSVLLAFFGILLMGTGYSIAFPGAPELTNGYLHNCQGILYMDFIDTNTVRMTCPKVDTRPYEFTIPADNNLVDILRGLSGQENKSIIVDDQGNLLQILSLNQSARVYIIWTSE